MDPLTSTSWSRPAGGVEEKLPDSTSAGGVRRSGRVRSDVDPAPPATVGSRKAPSEEGKPASKAGVKKGPAVRKGSSKGQAVEQWGQRRPKESMATYGSRLAAEFGEYELLGRKLRELREELKFTKYQASMTSKRRRPEYSARVKSLKLEIEEAEMWRMAVLEGNDLFREKLLNDDRFSRMKTPGKGEEDGGDCPADSESSSDDEAQDMEAEEAEVSVPASEEAVEAKSQTVQHVQGVDMPQASKLAGQVALSPASGESAGKEEEGCGGALLAQIVNLESPVHLDHFSFGEDLGEEHLIKERKKGQKKPSGQLSLVYVPLVHTEPAANSVQGVDPSNLPVPLSASVERGQNTGKNTVKMAESDDLACQSSGASTSIETAKGPDNVVGKVACPQSEGFGAAGHSSAGEGGSVRAPRAGMELGRLGNGEGEGEGGS